MADGVVTTDQRNGVRRLRIEADPQSVEKGLVTLVLTLVELLRQLMERQALRRVDQGTLTDDDHPAGQHPVEQVHQGNAFGLDHGVVPRPGHRGPDPSPSPTKE